MAKHLLWRFGSWLGLSAAGGFVVKETVADAVIHQIESTIAEAIGVQEAAVVAFIATYSVPALIAWLIVRKVYRLGQSSVAGDAGNPVTSTGWHFPWITSAPPNEAKAESKPAPSAEEGDIDASDAFNQILNGSAWQEEQKRKTKDTSNLVSNWLQVRLDTQIHNALVNDRLTAWGEEILPNGAIGPERPIPPKSWETVEIGFGPTGRRTCASARVNPTYTGKLAWVGVKFSRAQIFKMFPLTASNDWRPIHIAIEHISEKIGDRDGSGCFPEARRVLRQSAYDQRVKLRGRKQLVDRPIFRKGEYSEIYTDIDRDYWTTSEINALATSEDPRSQSNYHTDPQTAFAWGPKGLDERNRYAQLLVNWSDILKEWPQ